MKISDMNIRILVQKSVTIIDSIGNHINAWEDYYSCHASAFTKSMGESDGAGHTEVNETVDFNARYSSEMAGISADRYRIIFNGKIYNIKAVDFMGFKNRSVRIYAEREKKSGSDGKT